MNKVSYVYVSASIFVLIMIIGHLLIENIFLLGALASFMLSMITYVYIKKGFDDE